MGSKDVSRRPLSIGQVDILEIFPIFWTKTTPKNRGKKNFVTDLWVQNACLDALYRSVRSAFYIFSGPSERNYPWDLE